MFLNKTFEINYEKKGFLTYYDVVINSIHTNSVDGFDIKDISFINGTDTLQVTVGGVNIDATVDGHVTCLWLIPVDITAFKLTNVTMQLQIATTTSDKVHFEVVGASFFSVGDLNLTMSSSIWQKLVDAGHWAIMKAVNVACSMLSDAVDAKVVLYNEKIRNEGPTTFVTTLLGVAMPLNLTMTRYPILSSADNMVYLNMDGRFLEAMTNTTQVPENVEWQPREKVQKEQFFIHESSLNSLLYDISATGPIMLNSTSATKSVLMIFHEFAAFYGPDVSLEIGVSLAENQSTDAIQIDSKRGIVFGSTEAGDLKTVVTFYASNATTPSEEALQLEMNLQMVFNVSLVDFLATIQIEDTNIANTVVMYDHIGMYKHDYDAMLSSVLEDVIFDLNWKYQNGIDFKVLYPTLAFVAGLLRNSVITPFELDHFIYAGFSWISDF